MDWSGYLGCEVCKAVAGAPCWTRSGGGPAALPDEFCDRPHAARPTRAPGKPPGKPPAGGSATLPRSPVRVTGRTTAIGATSGTDVNSAGARPQKIRDREQRQADADAGGSRAQRRAAGVTAAAEKAKKKKEAAADRQPPAWLKLPARAPGPR